jgi:Domain of unknown function (DUF6265)
MSRLAALFLLWAACVAPCQAQAPAVAQLQWLSGCWAATGGEPGSGEQWMAPAAGVMLGMARTVRLGNVRQFEFMQLRDTPQGPVFVAWLSGKEPTTFAAERIDARTAAFRNDGHDFPQRVVYQLADDGALDARIEGHVQGQPRVIRFPMKRTSCPP